MVGLAPPLKVYKKETRKTEFARSGRESAAREMNRTKRAKKSEIQRNVYGSNICHSNQNGEKKKTLTLESVFYVDVEPKLTHKILIVTS